VLTWRLLNSYVVSYKHRAPTERLHVNGRLPARNGEWLCT